MDFSATAEWTAVALALVYVYLATKGLRSCFIFGLISSALFVDICYADRLYFDTAINAYYVVMSIVGWFSWKEVSEGHIIPVMMSRKAFGYSAFLALLLSLLLGYFTHQYSDASLPFIDAFTTVMAVLATWLMVKKVIQNWLIWVAADAVSIFMYLYKGHLAISILFLVYTIIAVYGYTNWKRIRLES